MKLTSCLLALVTSLISICAIGTVFAAAVPKLAAPIYPGAVAAVPAESAEASAPYVATFGDIKALDCRGSRSSTEFKAGPLDEYERLNADSLLGPWCFLTRDPIDKVKAFYEKSVGPVRPIQGENGAYGYVAYLERAWYPGGEETPPQFLYSSVSVHALPPPPVRGQTQLPANVGEEEIATQEDYLTYSQFRHLGLFHLSVAWFGPEPGKHDPPDIAAMARKYGHLESAFFQHKGPELMPVDRALEKHYSELQGQRVEAAVMAPISGRQQLAATAAQGGSGASAANDAKINSIMERNPELRREYSALTQQLGTLMQQGKYDEADRVMEKIDALEQSNPELAAMNEGDQARQNSLNKASQAQEDAIDAAANKQMDEALWGTAIEYIQAVDKVDYYTLIVIDNALTRYEKDYSNDRAIVDADTAGWVDISGTDSFGVVYKQSFDGSGKPVAGEPAVEAEKKEGLEEKAKGFLKKFKKPF